MVKLWWGIFSGNLRHFKYSRNFTTAVQLLECWVTILKILCKIDNNLFTPQLHFMIDLSFIMLILEIDLKILECEGGGFMG
jgi:hypothetical protein